MFPAAATIKPANRRAPNCDTRARRNTAKRPRIGTGMAETTEKTSEKKLSVAPTKTLSLKRPGVEQGVVKQSFSHGRTKAVVVEKVKSRRGDAKTEAAPAAATPAAAPAPTGPVRRTLTAARPTAAAAPAATPAGAGAKPAGGVVLRTLTD